MRKLIKNEYIRYFLIDTIIGLFLIGMMLLYSQNYSLIGFIDATLVAAFLLLSIGWFLYISNHNVFDLMVYGVQSFWKGVFGKRMKKSYIEHLYAKEQIKPSIYRCLWLSSIPLLIADLILYLIYKL
jgi:hypothetical protein